MKTRGRLIERFDSFRRAAGMSERQFALAATGDSKFVARLRAGAGVTLTLIERAERFIAEHEAPPSQRRNRRAA